MMPVIFVGHGSPMNAIEDNEFTKSWKQIVPDIPGPKAILCVSAHWETKGTRVSILEHPKTIHDFYGFPKALFDVEYNVQGSPFYARKTLELLGNTAAEDISWGIDHGAWSVLRVMYPEADIPVYQLSIDQDASAKEIFRIGQMLAPLREEGILIIGSGNIVHNLRIFDFSIAGGFDWAESFDDYIGEKIKDRDFDSIIGARDDRDGANPTGVNKIGARDLSEAARLAIPTTEHFNPLIYVLGAVKSSDKVEIYNKACVAGSISMTSYLFG